MSEDHLRAELECAKQEVAELLAKLAAAEAERDIAMEKAAEAYRELDAHQQAGQLMASQCELVNAEREAAEARAAKAEAAIDRALQLFDPDYPDNPIRPQDRGEKAAQQVLRAALAQENPNE